MPNFMCSVCGMGFSRKYSLTRHYTRRHPEEDTYAPSRRSENAGNIPKAEKLKHPEEETDAPSQRSENAGNIPKAEKLKHPEEETDAPSQRSENAGNIPKAEKRKHPEEETDAPSQRSENAGNIPKAEKRKHPEEETDAPSEKRKHSEEETDAPSQRSENAGWLECPLCDKTYCSIRSRNLHIKRIHNLLINKDTTTQIICPECGDKFTNVKEINSHLTKSHKIHLEIVQMRFSSFQEFELWKTKIEEEELSSYVKHSGMKKVGEGERAYYKCHRSGIPRTKDNRERIYFKSPCKNGAYCPSSITATKLATGEVEVKFFKNHVGHTTGIQHLRLTQDQRAMLASKVASHVPLKQIIIKDIRDTVSKESGVSRLHMCDRKDLYNIIRDFKLDTDKINTNDVLSVDMWIKQQLSMGEKSIVRYYKEQGLEDPENNLKKEDFMVVIMTDFQQEVLKGFSEEKILIDSTHGTNAYSFLLTSLLTVDEYGAGIPGSFCLSNRTDKKAMEVFFEIVKAHTGVLQSKVFMSDDAPAFYNAWLEIMGPCEHQLICTWHVDKAWRENVRTKLKSTEKAAEVYKGCRVLLEEQDQSVFQILLPGFLNKCERDTETADFGAYFRKYYYARPQLWAYCYRKRVGVNTNMYLEALHKKIKYCYLDGKKNRRVDKCISVLLQLSRDIMFERLSRQLKQKPTSRMLAISRSHKKSAKITDTMIKKTGPNVWVVESSVPQRGPYTVVNNTNVTCRCPLSCPVCQICVHQVSCNCIDHTSKLNICKHIHACMRHLNKPNEKCIPDQNVHAEMKLVAECSTTVNTSMADSVTLSTQIQVMMDKNKGLCLKYPHLVSKFFKETELFTKRLNKIVEQDEKSQQDKAPPTPANKNIEKQRCFKSTVKRKQRTERVLVKPGDQQKAVMSEMFISEETDNDVISIQCSGDPDHTYQSWT